MSYNIDSDSFHGTKKGMRRKTVSKRRAYEYTPRQFDKELSQIYNNVVLNKTDKALNQITKLRTSLIKLM